VMGSLVALIKSYMEAHPWGLMAQAL
jgi:hypothetical protein